MFQIITKLGNGLERAEQERELTLREELISLSLSLSFHSQEDEDAIEK